MYEMVMLVAMTASAESPAFFKKRGRAGVVNSGCSGYVPSDPVVNGCGGYIPSGTVVYSGGCSGTIISITPIEASANKPTEGKPTDGKPTDGKPTEGKPTDGKPTDGKPTDGKPTDGKPTDGKPGGKPGSGDKPGPGDSRLTREEVKWLAYIVKNTEGAKEKKEAADYFRGATPAERKKYYDDTKKDVEGGGAKPTPVTAEEQKWLDYILKNTEGDKAKKEAEEYFKGTTPAERKKYYDDTKKDVEGAVKAPAPVSADEQKWLDYILKNTEGAKEKKEAEAYFKASNAAERKKYYEDTKKDVEGK
jgi:hypothetical protein